MLHIKLPEGVGDKTVIKDFFTKIADSLECAQFDQSLVHLYNLFIYLRKNVFPHVGKGHSIVLDMGVWWDFSISDAIDLIENNFSHVKYNDVIIEKYLKQPCGEVTWINGTILANILVSGLNRAAMTENEKEISIYSVLNFMFVIFTRVTENEFSAPLGDFKKIDNLIDDLKIPQLLSPLPPIEPTRWQNMVSFFAKPVGPSLQYMQSFYQNYLQRK